MDSFRQADEGELAAVYALRARAFAGEAAWFARHDRDDPWRAAGANYVAACGGRVVATLRIFARHIRLGPEDIPVACFGDVATDPPYRGRGYMRRLLALANEQNAAHGFALGLLATGSPGVYVGAGFRVVPVPWYALDLPLPATVRARADALVREATGGGRWVIVPWAAARQAGVRAVYEAFGRGRPGYPVREDALWSHLSSASRANSPAWLRLATNGDGSLAAYLLAATPGRNPRGLTILECPYAPGAEEAAHLLTAALASDPAVRAAGWPSVAGALPGDHALFAADAPLPGRRGTAEYLMLRPYTPRGAQAEEMLRREAAGRFVYWLGDNV